MIYNLQKSDVTFYQKFSFLKRVIIKIFVRSNYLKIVTNSKKISKYFIEQPLAIYSNQRYINNYMLLFIYFLGILIVTFNGTFSFRSPILCANFVSTKRPDCKTI